MMPMMMAGAIPEVLAEAAPDAKASSTPGSEPPRKLFPETWIWSDLIAGFYFIMFLNNCLIIFEKCKLNYFLNVKYLTEKMLK